ncbi:MAG: glutamate racemase, partial [Desulfohalobiaceae bacterium]
RTPSRMIGSAQSPIGVFDSGVGGLSVLQAIRQRLPAEDLIYVADTAHVPYGSKPRELIQKRCLKLGDFLCRQGAKAVVVACNTATAAGIEGLRSWLQIPVLGMEPGIKPAVTASKNKIIGILATQGTLQSDRYHDLMRRCRQDSQIYTQACSGLVELIEQGGFQEPETLELLKSYIQPLLQQGADTLVLGCTHYPLLIEQIQAQAGKEVTIIDTGHPLARHLHNRLSRANILAQRKTQGRLSIYSTGQTQGLQAIADRLGLECWVRDIEL